MRAESVKTASKPSNGKKRSPGKSSRQKSPAVIARRLLREHTSKLKIVERPIDSLIPYRGNPRTHSDKQISKIAASIKKFGFTNPILTDRHDVVVAGHGRLEAAKRLGLVTVPTIRLEDMSEADRRAYAIADNKLAELAGWDQALLAIELHYLDDLVELTELGFDTHEVDIVLDPEGEQSNDPLDETPQVDTERPPISRLGDLWELGPHMLLCGDTLNPDNFKRLLNGSVAEMVWTDPPYNVPIEGNVSGLGKKKHREFPMASGEMSEAGFAEFLETAMKNHASFSAEGSIHYLWIDWRSVELMLRAGCKAYTELKGIAVWNKNAAGMGTFYRQKHEFVCIFKKGNGKHINNFELGQNGRYRTTVWDAPVPRTVRADHPTPKPVCLTIEAMKDCSNRGGIILDGFAGSGTTIIAAEKARRLARCIELDPLYVDVAVRRWQLLTGESAVLSGTREIFCEVEHRRRGERPDPVNHQNGRRA